MVWLDAYSQGTEARLQRRLATAAALLLTASASQADSSTCTRRNSAAWCILNAAGYSDGARDVSLQKAQAFLAKFVPSASDGTAKVDAGGLVIAGLEAAKLTSTVPGIGRGTSIGMALLGAFIDGRKPGEKIQMFMFMPESSVNRPGSPRHP